MAVSVGGFMAMEEALVVQHPTSKTRVAAGGIGLRSTTSTMKAPLLLLGDGKRRHPRAVRNEKLRKSSHLSLKSLKLTFLVSMIMNYHQKPLPKISLQTARRPPQAPWMTDSVRCSLVALTTISMIFNQQHQTRKMCQNRQYQGCPYHQHHYRLPVRAHK